jgi:hypothetical protein
MEEDRRYDEVRRCLSEADQAFARAGATEDEGERQRLIDEAETWLMRAERRLARLTDRPVNFARPHTVAREARSFEDAPPAHSTLIWRRTPKA